MIVAFSFIVTETETQVGFSCNKRVLLLFLQLHHTAAHTEHGMF